MNSRKTIIGAVLGVAALMLAYFAVPANAQDYPPTGPTLVIETPTVAQGGVLKGCSTGLEPGTARAEFNPSFTFTVAADGTGCFEFTIPCSQPVGNSTLTATSGSTSASAVFAVTPGCTAAPAPAAPGQAAAGALPRTGTDASLPMTQTAVAAIAAGGLMILMANKRRKATTA